MLVRFARDYGWRAYAIPVLLVITVWVFVDVFRGAAGAENPSPAPVAAMASPSMKQPPTTPGPAPLGEGPNPATQPPIPGAAVNEELPPGGPFTEQGSGLFHLASRGGPVVGQGTKKTFTYTIEVEEGLDPAHFGGDDAFATMVKTTLSDPRGWTHDPRFAFQEISGTDGKKPDFRIQLTSAGTTHEMCGQDIRSETSCYTAMGNRVLINEARWIRGAFTFNGDVGSYRRYLINHEVGHAIGYRNHEACGANGALAPVMMQQTLSLSNDELHRLSPQEVYPVNGFICRYNAWPYPTV